jgi:hypothetical protein
MRLFALLFILINEIAKIFQLFTHSRFALDCLVDDAGKEINIKGARSVTNANASPYQLERLPGKHTEKAIR